MILKLLARAVVVTDDNQATAALRELDRRRAKVFIVRMFAPRSTNLDADDRGPP